MPRTAGHDVGNDFNIEFVMEQSIPFLSNHAMGYTMCDFKLGRTPVTNAGEHVHAWCWPCADALAPGQLRDRHASCSECVALRTLCVLSCQWNLSCGQRSRKALMTSPNISDAMQ